MKGKKKEADKWQSTSVVNFTSARFLSTLHTLSFLNPVTNDSGGGIAAPAAHIHTRFGGERTTEEMGSVCVCVCGCVGGATKPTPKIGLNGGIGG